MDIWSIQWSVAALVEVLNSKEAKPDKTVRLERFSRQELVERQAKKQQRMDYSEEKEAKAA